MINWKELNSVIFETLNLNKIREFYEGQLGLEVNRYESGGKEIADVTDRYVNYKIGGCLIGFEMGGKIDTGSFVLYVSDLAETRVILGKKLTFRRNQNFFISFSDPDGREIIVEQAS